MFSLVGEPFWVWGNNSSHKLRKVSVFRSNARPSVFLRFRALFEHARHGSGMKSIGAQTFAFCGEQSEFCLAGLCSRSVLAGYLGLCRLRKHRGILAHGLRRLSRLPLLRLLVVRLGGLSGRFFPKGRRVGSTILGLDRSWRLRILMRTRLIVGAGAR